MLVLELCDDLNFIHGLSVNSPPEETPASTIPLLSTTPALITAASEAYVSTTPSQTPEPLGNGTTVIPGETSFDGVMRIVTLDGKPALFNASLEAPGNSYYLTLHDNVVKIVSFSPTNKVSLLHCYMLHASLFLCHFVSLEETRVLYGSLVILCLFSTSPFIVYLGRLLERKVAVD